MITAKINVSKIDKNRLYKGEKGSYLSIAIIPTPDSKYGDYMIVEEITKEEREAGKKGTILGNGKNLAKEGKAIDSGSKAKEPQDDLPF